MARKTKTADVTPATVAEVRTWANEQGLTVAQRGRLSATVKQAYTEATGRPVAAPTAV